MSRLGAWATCTFTIIFNRQPANLNLSNIHLTSTMEATEEQKARWSNPYPPYDKTDFKALAERDEEFAVLFNSYGGALNWQDFEVVKAVTKSMLKVDFGLDISIPDDRLCPPVPNRWNYVHWIQSLIDSTNPDFSESYDPNREVIGLDIGTGASAIYAMLMLRTRPNWTMCATDVDKKSMDSAAANLASNSLLSRTKILQTIPENSLIPIKAFNVDKLDFTMCNPPWYSSEFEMKAALKGEGKRLPPNAICTGSQTEMVYPEGDLGFATKIYEESLELKEKVTWYSCLFGKYTSMISFVQRLKNENATSNFAVTSLLGGSQTKRWAVAWSFGSIRPAKVSTSRFSCMLFLLWTVFHKGKFD